MTADPHGWPDPARPGVPMNPERRWVHAIDVHGNAWLSMWEAKDQSWDFGCTGAVFTDPGAFARHCAEEGYLYLGPCLTPAEVAAREAAAAEAMRRECVKAARSEKNDADNPDEAEQAWNDACECVVTAMAGLDLPAPAALRAMADEAGE